MDSEAWQIRSMQLSDLDAVMFIENASFSSPWSRESFINDFEQTNAQILVGLKNNTLAGYIVAWLVLDEIHIGNLAVHPEFRRQKLAQTLIDYCVKSNPQAVWIWLEVRKSNQPAKKLYKKLGFREAGIRKKYYQAENEDAIVMIKEIVRK